MLKEGDIIELKKGHTISADIPEHFVYANKRGSFKLTYHTITLSHEFDYLIGKYIVYKIVFDGGSYDGSYPNGHHVFCVKDNNQLIKVDFYQSGCFTTVIEEIEPVGRATLQWRIDV